MYIFNSLFKVYKFSHVKKITLYKIACMSWISQRIKYLCECVCPFSISDFLLLFQLKIIIHIFVIQQVSWNLTEIQFRSALDLGKVSWNGRNVNFLKFFGNSCYLVILLSKSRPWSNLSNSTFLNRKNPSLNY